MVAQTDKKGNT